MLLGSIGKLEFEIESTGTELDYICNIGINSDLPKDLFEDNHNEISDYRIYAYQVKTIYGDTEDDTPFENKLVAQDATTIETVVAKASEVNQKVLTKYILYVKWDDSKDNFSDDSGDVALSKKENINGKINLVIKVAQAEEPADSDSDTDNSDDTDQTDPSEETP